MIEVEVHTDGCDSGPFRNVSHVHASEKTRVLTMYYTAHYEVKRHIDPGACGAARAVEDITRYLSGQPHIDPESVRFTVADR